MLAVFFFFSVHGSRKGSLKEYDFKLFKFKCLLCVRTVWCFFFAIHERKKKLISVNITYLNNTAHTSGRWFICCRMFYKCKKKKWNSAGHNRVKMTICFFFLHQKCVAFNFIFYIYVHFFLKWTFFRTILCLFNQLLLIIHNFLCVVYCRSHALFIGSFYSVMCIFDQLIPKLWRLYESILVNRNGQNIQLEYIIL